MSDAPDCWPQKSIGFILSSWISSLPGLIKIVNTPNSSISIVLTRLYPLLCIVALTFQSNRVHPLLMVNMSAKFDEDALNCLASSHSQGQGVTHRLTHRLMARRNHSCDPISYIPSTTCCVGMIKRRGKNEHLFTQIEAITPLANIQNLRNKTRNMFVKQGCPCSNKVKIWKNL